MQFKIDSNSFEMVGIFLHVETKRTEHLVKASLYIFLAVEKYINWC